MMGRGILRYMAAASLAAACSSAMAASIYTESFNVAPEGWQDRDAGKMAVSWQSSGGHPGGCLRGSFSKQAYPLPQNDGFTATGTLASAAFTGDYRAAGIWLVGFDFMAADAIPAVAEVRLYSGNSYASRFFHTAVTSTGVWHSFRFPLYAAQADGWIVPSPGLTQVMSNISRVEFVINRANDAAQAVYVDNIFVDALPESDGLSIAPGQGPRMVWQNVRAGDVYRIEATAELAPPQWQVIMVATAQTAVIEMDFDQNEQHQFFRLVAP